MDKPHTDNQESNALDYASGISEWREKWKLPLLSLPRIKGTTRPGCPSMLCQDFEEFKSSLLSA